MHTWIHNLQYVSVMPGNAKHKRNSTAITCKASEMLEKPNTNPTPNQIL